MGLPYTGVQGGPHTEVEEHMTDVDVIKGRKEDSDGGGANVLL